MRTLLFSLLLISNICFSQQTGVDSFYRVTVKLFSPFFLNTNIEDIYLHDTVDVFVTDHFRVYKLHNSVENFNISQSYANGMEDTIMIVQARGERKFYSTYIYQPASELNGTELDASTFRSTGVLHNIDSILKVKNIAGEFGNIVDQSNFILTLLSEKGKIQQYLWAGIQEGDKCNTGNLFITTDVTFEGFPLSLSWVLDSITNTKVVDVYCQIPNNLLIPREGLPKEILDQLNELPDNIEYRWSILRVPLCSEQKRMLRMIQHTNDH